MIDDKEFTTFGYEVLEGFTPLPVGRIISNSVFPFWSLLVVINMVKITLGMHVIFGFYHKEVLTRPTVGSPSFFTFAFLGVLRQRILFP